MLKKMFQDMYLLTGDRNVSKEFSIILKNILEVMIKGEEPWWFVEETAEMVKRVWPQGGGLHSLQKFFFSSHLIIRKTFYVLFLRSSLPQHSENDSCNKVVKVLPVQMQFNTLPAITNTRRDLRLSASQQRHRLMCFKKHNTSFNYR